MYIITFTCSPSHCGTWQTSVRRAKFSKLPVQQNMWKVPQTIIDALSFPMVAIEVGARGVSNNSTFLLHAVQQKQTVYADYCLPTPQRLGSDGRVRTPRLVTKLPLSSQPLSLCLRWLGLRVSCILTPFCPFSPSDVQGMRLAGQSWESLRHLKAPPPPPPIFEVSVQP